MFSQQSIHVALLLWGAVFSLIAALFMIMAKGFEERKRRCMIYMQLACALLMFSDAGAWAFRGMPGLKACYGVKLSNFGVFFLSDIILLIFHMFVCASLFRGYPYRDQMSVQRFPRVRISAGYAIALLAGTLVIISQLNDMYYYIDAQNYYHRNTFHILSFLIPLLGILIDLSLLVQYRSRISRQNFLSLISYIALPFAATIVQLFVYGFSLINLSICFSVILMFVTAVAEQNRQLVYREQETRALKGSLQSAIMDRQSCYTAAAQIYSSMHLVDVETGRYSAIKTNDAIESSVNPAEQNVFQKQIVNVMKRMVTGEYVDRVLSFTDLGTLAKKMEGKNSIELVFLGRVSGWCRARFIRTDAHSAGTLRQVLFCIEVIDEEKRREKKLQLLAETDAMTGILNRGSGERRVAAMMGQKEQGMFCLLDCDKFKSINDSYGHSVGDAVIVAVAECLKKTCRDRDVVFRLGGDEFAMFLPGLTEKREAEDFLNRIFRAVETICIPELGEKKISISSGASFFSGDGKNFDDLYKEADLAMYESKKTEGCSASVYAD